MKYQTYMILAAAAIICLLIGMGTSIYLISSELSTARETIVTQQKTIGQLGQEKVKLTNDLEKALADLGKIKQQMIDQSKNIQSTKKKP